MASAISIISTLSDTDVVFHSGNRYANASQGTKIWSLLIAANKPLFGSLTSSTDQQTLAASIVHAVTSVGGKFLVLDKHSGRYYNVGVVCAQDSTLFALGSKEPQHAEHTEDIPKVLRLYQHQCLYFDTQTDVELKMQVTTIVQEQLNRLANQARHVQQTTLVRYPTNTNCEPLKPKDEKESEDNGESQQKEEEEEKEVAKDEQLPNDEQEETTDEVEPPRGDKEEETEGSPLAETHGLDQVILEKEEEEETTSTKRQRVE